MKKVISVLAVLLSMVCILTACVPGQTSLEYEWDRAGYYNVVGLGNAQGPEVVIPETYDNEPVKALCYYSATVSTLSYDKDSSLNEEDIKTLDARVIDYFGLGSLKKLTGIETLYISSLLAQKSGSSPMFRLWYLFETDEGSLNTDGKEARDSLKTLFYAPSETDLNKSVEEKFAYFSNLETIVIEGYCPVLMEGDFYSTGLKHLYLPKDVRGIEYLALEGVGRDSASAFVIHYAGTEEEWNAIEKDENWDACRYNANQYEKANYTIEFQSVYEG